MPASGPGDDRAPAWPADNAFVLRFAAGVDPARGILAGRVEHVVSGRGQRFESCDELLAFVARMLRVSAREA